MTSEAAQKAYPNAENEAGSLSRSNVPVQRAAFDAGAVEALRQAADHFLIAGNDPVSRFLNDMADEWEAGQ